MLFIFAVGLIFYSPLTVNKKRLLTSHTPFTIKQKK